MSYSCTLNISSFTR